MDGIIIAYIIDREIILRINDLLPLCFYQGEYFSINVVLEISTCMRLLVLISFDDSVNHDRMIEHGGNRQTYIHRGN